jgi:hypothetical protein
MEFSRSISTEASGTSCRNVVSDLLLLEIVGEALLEAGGAGTWLRNPETRDKNTGHRTVEVEGVQDALRQFPAAREPETSKAPAGDAHQDRKSRTHMIDRQGRVYK